MFTLTPKVPKLLLIHCSDEDIKLTPALCWSGSSWCLPPFDLPACSAVTDSRWTCRRRPPRSSSPRRSSSHGSLVWTQTNVSDIRFKQIFRVGNETECGITGKSEVEKCNKCHFLCRWWWGNLLKFGFFFGTGCSKHHFDSYVLLLVCRAATNNYCKHQSTCQLFSLLTITFYKLSKKT